MQSTAAATSGGSAHHERQQALAQLHMALNAAGVSSVLVVPPPRPGQGKKRATSPASPHRSGAGKSGQESPVEGSREGQASMKVGPASRGIDNKTSVGLPADRLEAGDIVIFPASNPMPAQWMQAARVRQVLLVSWIFSWRDLLTDGTLNGLDAPPNPLWLQWPQGVST